MRAAAVHLAAQTVEVPSKEREVLLGEVDGPAVGRLTANSPATPSWTGGKNRDLLLPAGSEWYNSHIRCALASILERASASGRIPGVALGSRRRGSCSPSPIGSISDPTFRSSFWPSAGRVTGCILSFLKSGRTKRARFCTS